MCTAATYKTNDFYFGRTLDYDITYPSEVTVTPRSFPFHFRNGNNVTRHYAIIGMAYNKNGFPLYFDAVNEVGLCIAGLNFAGNAKYCEESNYKENIAQFELIPRLLGQCKNVAEVRKVLEKTNITNTPFSADLPITPLHWIIADKTECITLEAVSDGIKIYENPIGILTNNPPFKEQLTNLKNYMNLSPKEPVNRFSDKIELSPYSRGMGAIGLPGDLSSESRFVRAAFVKLNSVSDKTEMDSIGQFFHILGSVCQVRGCCETENGKYEITQYSSCCNADKGIYYYTTYNNSTITAVNMNNENLNGSQTIIFPLISHEQVVFQN